MKQVLLALGIILSVQAYAQKGVLKGQILDAETEEPLIGANVVVAAGSGTFTDLNGDYSMELDYGTYNVEVSYIGFETFYQKIEINSPSKVYNASLETITLKEVRVVADIAIDRKTPVAFTNVSAKKIEEELAGRDLPMVLNSTPGVYATESGGGDGDARITIRGFNQRNIAVMLDGIPVNDMENGWVYWSNWFGLDAVTRTVQVQRGLSASKLAIPSVGGTINIITKGIESKRSIVAQQELGNNWYSKTSLGFNSGRLNGGWGFTVAGSYKRANGWVDALFTDAWFYYAKIEKSFNDKHIVVLSAMGAPQEHGQRSFRRAIGDWDKEYALEKVDIAEENLTTALDKGLRYNPHWGWLQREGDSKRKKFNERKNYYHKPQFSLRHSWTVNPKIFISNIAYASIGSGGGTSSRGIAADSTGQLPFQQKYNIQNSIGGRAAAYLRASVNNHQWFGLLSTVNYDISQNWTFAGGVDLRTYKAEHYREVYDLLGADYITDDGNLNQDKATEIKAGDKFDYYNDGKVRWLGAFGMVEYSDAVWSSFVNFSGSNSSYYKIDYFDSKFVEVDGEKIDVPFGSTVEVNGQTYSNDSPEAKFKEADWIHLPGFAVKAGASLNIDESNSVYLNLGYLSKAPRYNNVIYLFDVTVFNNYENEKIQALEIGYKLKKRKYKANLNSYITKWENKPLNSAPTIPDPIDPEERVPLNINGLGALHMGVEFEGSYQILPTLALEGIASIGDWIWNTVVDSASYRDGNGDFHYFSFDPKGVHVGDAAQIQAALMLRYEPTKDLYFKLKYTYFAKHFADFQPEDLDEEELFGRESWRTPSYGLLDFHAGYTFPIEKVNLRLTFNAINILNQKYISDARNNDRFNTQPFTDFDAKSASVFFGQGFRFNTSLKLKI